MLELNGQAVWSLKVNLHFSYILRLILPCIADFLLFAKIITYLKAFVKSGLWLGRFIQK